MTGILRGSGTNVRCLMTSVRSSVTVKKNRSAVTVPLMVGAPTRFAPCRKVCQNGSQKVSQKASGRHDDFRRFIEAATPATST
jgi:hypothetical protein